jgi:hypothetical protein
MIVRKHYRVAIFGTLVFAACSAHNPFIVTNQTQSSLSSNATYPPHHEKVFVTEQSLPAVVPFDLIGTIDIGKVWYESSDDVLTAMADRARELGANAVIQVKTWHQPSGFSWYAPHGSGQAVWIKDVSVLDPLHLTGNWR